MRPITPFTLIAIAIGAFPALAEEGGRPMPSAIVEDVQGIAALSRLDLLIPGKEIDLGDRGRLVLGYFNSCWQDAVTGGRLLVGEQKSVVKGGTMIRRRVDCDPSRTPDTKTSREAKARGLSAEAPAPHLVLFGRSPIVLVGQPNVKLLIERIDSRTLTRITEIDLTTDRLDLADRNIALEAGSIYRLSAAGSLLLIKIDPIAESGRTPAVGRLVMLH